MAFSRFFGSRRQQPARVVSVWPGEDSEAIVRKHTLETLEREYEAIQQVISPVKRQAKEQLDRGNRAKATAILQHIQIKDKHAKALYARINMLRNLDDAHKMATLGARADSIISSHSKSLKEIKSQSKVDTLDVIEDAREAIDGITLEDDWVTESEMGFSGQGVENMLDELENDSLDEDGTDLLRQWPTASDLRTDPYLYPEVPTQEPGESRGGGGGAAVVAEEDNTLEDWLAS